MNDGALRKRDLLYENVITGNSLTFLLVIDQRDFEAPETNH